METLQYGEYWLLKNYIRGLKSTNTRCMESITYTTNGDYTFMDNLPRVVERWLAPVSFALYAPGDDYNATMDSIQYVRNCLPESPLIRDYVTFHIYFPRKHLSPFIATTEEKALEWPYNCNDISAPYVNVNRSEMYKTLKNLTYPINVGRNIARKSANTYFIFACDIELYPNKNFVNKFLEMAAKNPHEFVKSKKPKVFALPVFEVATNASIPDTKEQLVKMLNDSTAVPFHMYVCPNCHLIPKQKSWLKANDSEDLEIFTMGKRQGSFGSWEPFYISDNKEPMFDERVTWEGQSNKRVQNYAMCLLDYEYHVLHPAFLIHAPGIKKIHTQSKQFKTRIKYAAAMNKLIVQEIMPEYEVLYGVNKRCRI
ncbi:beta-1,4-glucuronyltransferase 1-like isoform 2-T2 [Cochliomyia hominivorax]